MLNRSLTRLFIGSVAFAVSVTGAFTLGRAEDLGIFKSGEALSATKLNQWIVPSGAVMAFDLDACPEGWSALSEARGRVIMGANPSEYSGIARHSRGDTPGEESHVLTVEEMPSHNHGGKTGEVMLSDGGGGFLCQKGEFYAALGPGTHSHTIAAQGGGVAHNNIQPSLVLLYCKKT